MFAINALKVKRVSAPSFILLLVLSKIVTALARVRGLDPIGHRTSPRTLASSLYRSVFRPSAIVLLLTHLSALNSNAEASEATFEGKQITIAVGYGAGGGFDLYARLLSQFMPKFIPGNPTIVVENVVGAGSLTLANRLYNTAPKDGTYIGMVAQTLPVDQLLGRPGISFDFSQFNAIGRIATSRTAFVVWRTAPILTVDDAQKTPVAIASTGPSSESFIVPALLNNLLKTKFNIIRGYSGTQEMLLAMERGEAAGTTVALSSLTSQFSRYLNNKDVRLVLLDAIDRDPAFPDIPTTVETARSDEDRDIMKLFGIGSEFGRYFIAPPGLPPSTLAALRHAFDQTVSDPDFVAAARKAGITLDPLDGEHLQLLFHSIVALKPATLKRAISAEQWDH